MVGRDEQRDRAVEALARHLLATGLSQCSLRQLAAAAGVSDRMLLYYFADKAEALALPMQRLAGEMSARLSGAVPEDARLTPQGFTARVAGLVVDAQFRPYMRLWIEAVAAAARQEEPFLQIVQGITAGFLQWIAAHLDDSVPDRDGTAAALLGMIDGLALVDICAGPEAARAAARSLGAD